MKFCRFVAPFVLVLAAIVAARAQVVIGPGPVRISASNSSFPGAGLTSSVTGAGGQIIRGVINFGAANLTQTTGNITVLNADYVSVAWHGGAGNVATACTTTPNCDQAYLTTTKIDATHITITATRAEQDGAVTPVVAYQVMDLSPTLVDAVYRGTTLGGAFAFTACPSGLTKTDVSWLGITGAQPSGNQMTVVAAAVNRATNGGNIANGVQVICWK